MMTRMNKKRIQKWKEYELIVASLRYLHNKHQKEADDNAKTFKDAMEFVAMYNEVEFRFMCLIHRYQTKADKLHRKIRRCQK